jgi:hypothetical protein
MASETLVTPAGEVLFANVLKPKLVKNDSGDKLQYGIVLLQADFLVLSPETVRLLP